MYRTTYHTDHETKILCLYMLGMTKRVIAQRVQTSPEIVKQLIKDTPLTAGQYEYHASLESDLRQKAGELTLIQLVVLMRCGGWGLAATEETMESDRQVADWLTGQRLAIRGTRPYQTARPQDVWHPPLNDDKPIGDLYKPRPDDPKLIQKGPNGHFKKHHVPKRNQYNHVHVPTHAEISRMATELREKNSPSEGAGQPQQRKGVQHSETSYLPQSEEIWRIAAQLRGQRGKPQSIPLGPTPPRAA